MVVPPWVPARGRESHLQRAAAAGAADSFGAAAVPVLLPSLRARRRALRARGPSRVRALEPPALRAGGRTGGRRIRLYRRPSVLWSPRVHSREYSSTLFRPCPTGALTRDGAHHSPPALPAPPRPCSHPSAAAAELRPAAAIPAHSSSPTPDGAGPRALRRIHIYRVASRFIALHPDISPVLHVAQRRQCAGGGGGGLHQFGFRYRRRYDRSDKCECYFECCAVDCTNGPNRAFSPCDRLIPDTHGW
jgi:hypothetical protein